MLLTRMGGQTCADCDKQTWTEDTEEHLGGAGGEVRENSTGNIGQHLRPRTCILRQHVVPLMAQYPIRMWFLFLRLENSQLMFLPPEASPAPMYIGL